MVSFFSLSFHFFSFHFIFFTNLFFHFLGSALRKGALGAFASKKMYQGQFFSLFSFRFIIFFIASNLFFIYQHFGTFAPKTMYQGQFFFVIFVSFFLFSLSLSNLFFFISYFQHFKMEHLELPQNVKSFLRHIFLFVLLVLILLTCFFWFLFLLPWS